MLTYKGQGQESWMSAAYPHTSTEETKREEHNCHIPFMFFSCLLRKWDNFYVAGQTEKGSSSLTII